MNLLRFLDLLLERQTFVWAHITTDVAALSCASMHSDHKPGCRAHDAQVALTAPV